MENVTIGRWTGDLDVAVNLMDGDLRDRVHGELAPCDAQVFVDRYCELHLVKFGQDFAVN